jgi:hypothetical protein
MSDIDEDERKEDEKMRKIQERFKQAAKKYALEFDTK